MTWQPADGPEPRSAFALQAYAAGSHNLGTPLSPVSDWLGLPASRARSVGVRQGLGSSVSANSPIARHVRTELSEGEQLEVGRKARAAVLAAPKTLDGEGTRQQILELARRDGGFRERELAALPPEKAQSNYRGYVDYRLSWALTNLKRDGLVENPRWSVWRLTGSELQEPTPATTKPVTPARLAELRAMPELKYLRTPEWRRTRTAALARAGHRCALDRSHTEGLEVHHNTYERVGAELTSDLVVLCHDCHRLHHRLNGRPKRPKTEEAATAARAAASIAPPPLPNIMTADQRATIGNPARPSLLRRLLAGG